MKTWHTLAAIALVLAIPAVAPAAAVTVKGVHLCCGACEKAAERTAELSRALAAGRLKWVDSVTADHAKHRIVVHARFLEPGKTIDVVELLGALDSVGFAPFSLRVSTGREQPLTGGPAALR